MHTASSVQPVAAMPAGTTVERVLAAPRPQGGQWAVRAVDIVVALALLAFLAPLLLLVAGLIWICDRSPPLDRQRCVGYGGRIFQRLRFRTMATDAEQTLYRLLTTSQDALEQWVRDGRLEIDPRQTRLGAILQKSGLDELPQLINILRGDMSIVGSRPLPEKEVARYGRYVRHYCSVKPGMTGLWQISRTSNPSYRRRVAMDVSYARRRGLALYLRILVLSVLAMLLAD